LGLRAGALDGERVAARRTGHALAEMGFGHLEQVASGASDFWHVCTSEG
jgi:hypothetical protein